MADDTDSPELDDSPEIDAGRALGVSRRGGGVPRGQDTGAITPINPSGPISPNTTPVIRSRGAQVLEPSAPTARSNPDDWDNTAEREKWKKKNPFSDRQMPGFLNPENDAPTRRQEIEMRRTAIAEKRAAREAQGLAVDTENSSREAQFRGSGQQFYTDPLTKVLTPIIDSQTGKPLYHETGWQKGEDPDSKTPVLFRRNKFGENEFQTPKIVHNPDLTDDQLYYDMGEHGTVPAGKIEDLINHKDFKIARQARTARRLRNAAMWKEATDGAKEDADTADVAFKQAEEKNLGLQQQQKELQDQIDQLNEQPLINQTAGGVLGIGAKPTDAAIQLTSQREALQLQLDAMSDAQGQVGAMVAPHGELARSARQARLAYGVLKTKAKHMEYSDLADDRRAILRNEGKSETDDPTLQSILAAQAKYGDSVDKYTKVFGQEKANGSVAKPAIDVPDAADATTTSPAPTPPGGAPKETANAMIGEPADLMRRGIKAVGEVKLPELARRYGTGTAALQPTALMRIHQRISAISETLENSDTQIDPKLRDNMTQESAYLEQLMATRMAKLPADKQKQVTEGIRDPTFWDKMKGLGKSIAEEGAKGGGAVLKGLAQFAENQGPMDMRTGYIDPEIARQYYEARAGETPQQKLDRIKGSPAYKMGSFIQEAAKEAYAKNPHEDEGVVSKALNAAGGAAGGFAPLIASGPAAPLTIGLQTAGDEMDRIYQEQIAKGVDKQKAASFAQERALAAGAIQAVLFEVLPKPLQKLGNKLIIDKIAGSALSKFMANRVAQASEGAVMGITTAGASNLATDRPLTEGMAESAEGLGLAQVVMPRAPGAPRKGKELPPPAPGATAEPPAPFKPTGRPSSAAQSAEVLEPALKEKANVPPASKSAEESAKVFDDVATTEESQGKVDSQQEGKLQKLVDEVQSATGKSREEILATRKDKEPADWAKELEYQKNPIAVDPDRHIAELKNDLTKLDDEWKQHVDRTGAEADKARATEAWMNGVKERESQRKADQAGKQERTAARAGDVETALSDSERVRQSRAGGEALKSDLAEKAKPTDRESELMARRDAIESQLSEAERVRQSNKGGADLREDLGKKSGREPPPEEPGGTPAEKPTPKPSAPAGENIVSRASKMTADEFRGWAQKESVPDGGPTGAAHKMGIDAIGNPKRIAALEAAHESAKAEWKKSHELAKTETGEAQTKAENDADSLMIKAQVFSEALDAARNTGSSIHTPEVSAAHEAHAKQTAAELLKGENFDKEWRDQGGRGGSENQVVFKNGKVYKRNYSQKTGQAVPNYGSIEAFNEHVKMHNELFPSAKLTHEGMSATSDGPAPVVSQREIKGKNASAKEIDDYMVARGFKETGRNGRYFNKQTGIEVSDLRDGNVLKDASGEFHVIDPVVKRIEKPAETNVPVDEPKTEASTPSSETASKPTATERIKEAESSAEETISKIRAGSRTPAEIAAAATSAAEKAKQTVDAVRAESAARAKETAEKIAQTKSLPPRAAEGILPPENKMPPAEPTAPSADAESAGAATDKELPKSVGSPATKTVDNPAAASKSKGSSRREIAQQTKLVRDLTARVEKLAQKFPDRVGDLQKQARAERDKLTQMQADKTQGTAPKVGTAPNGEADLISDVSDLVGTIRTKDPTGRGGESDSVSSDLSEGAARLLRSTDGMAPDQALEILNEAGYKFKTIGEMTTAIRRASQERKQMGARLKTEKYQQGVESKLMGGENPKAKGSMPVEELGVGSTFKVDGEKFSVVDVEEAADGTYHYVVQDGHKFMVPEGTMVSPDAKSVRGKAQSAEKVVAGFDPEKTPRAPGLISGTRAEAWADQKIKESATQVTAGLDPELIAAHAVKGAAILERGIQDFGAWSKEMTKQFGQKIEPHLKDIWTAAKSVMEGDDVKGAPAHVNAEIQSTGIRKKIADHFAKGDIEKAMAFTRDAVDNKAAVYGRENANVVHNRLDEAFPEKVQKDISRDALAFAVEAAGNEAALKQMAAKIAASDKAKPKWAQAALAAIEFARDNLEKMKPIVAEYNDQTNRQIAAEKGAGIDTLKYPNYVPHRQDIDTSGGHAFTGGGGGEASGFRKVRDYPTFADSIAAGIDPKSLNAVDLLQSRLTSGQQMVNRNAWVEGLKSYKDPISGGPVATDVTMRTRDDGTSYPEAPKGYKVEYLGNKDIAIHKGYEGIFSAMTDPGFWSKSPVRVMASKANAFGKSTALLVDSFHLGRLAFWNGAIRLNAFGTLGGGTELPKFWSHEKGINLLDQTPGEILRMAKEDGRPEAEIRDLIEQKKKLNLALDTGFNVGRITDALHNDFFHDFVTKATLGDKLGIVKFNKWLFDSFQRGAMTEIWLKEFDRQRDMKGFKDLTEKEVARNVSRDVNTRFGNLGRQGVFRSRNMQDIAKMLILAPQWNEGLIRSELGGAAQGAQALIRGVKGQGLATGMLARSVVTMVIGQFVANQLLNQYTRNKWTWENPEEGVGAKLSAWIPDKVGGGSGFFLHPLGLGAEITHLVMSRWEKTGSFREAAAAFARGRLSAIARPLATFILQSNNMGQRIRPDDLFKETVKEAVPQPIPTGSVAGAVKTLATGEKSEKFPGQFQKQLLSTVGVKTDQAPSDDQRIRALAHEFNIHHGVEPGAEYNVSDYSELTNALRVGNKSDSLASIKDLLVKHTPQQLVIAYKRQVHAPFTGNPRRELDFARSLTTEQRRAAVQARKNREKLRTDFNALLRQYLSQNKVEGASEARQAMIQ